MFLCAAGGQITPHLQAERERGDYTAVGRVEISEELGRGLVPGLELGEGEGGGEEGVVGGVDGGEGGEGKRGGHGDIQTANCALSGGEVRDRWLWGAAGTCRRSAKAGRSSEG